MSTISNTLFTVIVMFIVVFSNVFTMSFVIKCTSGPERHVLPRNSDINNTHAQNVLLVSTSTHNENNNLNTDEHLSKLGMPERSNVGKSNATQIPFVNSLKSSNALEESKAPMHRLVYASLQKRSSHMIVRRLDQLVSQANSLLGENQFCSLLHDLTLTLPGKVSCEECSNTNKMVTGSVFMAFRQIIPCLTKTDKYAKFMYNLLGQNGTLQHVKDVKVLFETMFILRGGNISSITSSVCQDKDVASLPDRAFFICRQLRNAKKLLNSIESNA